MGDNSIIFIRVLIRINVCDLDVELNILYVQELIKKGLFDLIYLHDLQGRRLERESARSMRKLSSSSPSSNKSASVSIVNRLASSIMMKQWMSRIWFKELRNLTIETSAIDSTVINAIFTMLSL